MYFILSLDILFEMTDYEKLKDFEGWVKNWKGDCISLEPKEILLRIQQGREDGYVKVAKEVFKGSEPLDKWKNKVRKDERDKIRRELYRLNWIGVLKNAIANRPGSWSKNPVREWRNTSDEILSALMTAMEKKGIFENPFKKLLEEPKDGGLG